MRYEPEIYARAFSDLLEKTKESEQNNLIKKFVLLIKKNGDLGGSEKIITSTQNYLSKKTGGRIVNIETASKLEDQDLQRITSNFKKSDVIKVIINPELLAGIRITINNEEELDYSLARKLKKMFNKK